MIRLLLVDDQQLVRAGFRVILDSEPDFEVVGEARDGVEAVELAAQLRPDVICMDVEMPNMNGIEATRQILANAVAGAGLGDAATGAATNTTATGANAAATGAGTNTTIGTSASSGATEAHATVPAVLVLTTFGHEAYLFDALAAGVSGFLLKTSRAEQLIDAVRTLASDQALLGPDVTRAVIERLSAQRSSVTDSAATPAAAAAEPSGGLAAMAEVGLTERERDVIRLLAEGRSNSEIAAALFLGETTVKTHVSNILQKLGARDRIQAVVWAHTNGILNC